MNWAKENPFLTGFIVISAVVIGGLGYYAFTNYSTYTELQAAYDTEVQKLHALQNRTPFPNEENLKQVVDSQKAYEAAVQELRKSLQELELPLNPDVSPQQFQDELRKAVSSAQAKAAEAGMRLPEDFYLGFNNYSSGLPRPEAVPHLARELRAIEAIFAGLVEAGVESLDQFVRTPLEIEGESRSRPGGGGSGGGGAKPLTKDLLDLTFTAEQGRVRLAVNSLLNSPQFAIIRAIRIQNSSPQGALKEVGTAETPGASAPEGVSSAPSASSPKALNMVFGREKITAQLRVELVNFEPLSSPSK